MNPYELLSADGQVILALCSTLGRVPDAAGVPIEPLKLSEWNELAQKIKASAIRQPSGMSGLTQTELSDQLAVPVSEGERLHALLARSGTLTLELEKWFSAGVWVVTRADAHYPSRLKQTLKHQAPSILFGAGDITLLQKAGMAVVGSRHIDEAGVNFAQEVGRKIAADGSPVVSGGAKGSDRLAMQAALDSSGIAFGVLADSLERTIRAAEVRDYIIDKRLVLLTPYAPTAGFSIGGAMGRNKIIYGLSECAFVVSSDLETGGTWAGAVEALKGSYCPVIVRADDNAPPGNHALIKRGALPIRSSELAEIGNLNQWLATLSVSKPTVQEMLFE